MGYVADRRFVPQHFVGNGPFQHLERAHYAAANGAWVAPPPSRPVTGGFSQVRPRPVTGGFTQVRPALHPVVRAMLQQQAPPPLMLNPAYAAGDISQSPVAYAQPNIDPALQAVLAALARTQRVPVPRY